MKTALILGCSHAAGSEMDTEPSVDLLDYRAEHYGHFMSYPAQLARLLGYHPISYAIPGGSNDAMFRVFESYCNPYKQLTKPDLVIACWTGGQRTEIWDFDECEWQGLAGGKTSFNKRMKDKTILAGKEIPEPIDNYDNIVGYQKQWITYHADRWWGRINKLKNILALNSMAVQEHVPVINIDSFDSVQEYTFPETVYRPLGNIEFINRSIECGFKNTLSGHFFIDAHTAFAKYAYKQIDPKYYASQD